MLIQLPSVDVVFAPPAYRLITGAEATDAHVQQTDDLAADSFTGDTPVDPARYRAWLAKNSRILLCLLDASGVVVGYGDLLPLTAPAVDALVRGTRTEQTIDGADLCAGNDPCPAGLYLTGLAVRDPASYRGRCNALRLLWGLCRLVADHYLPAPDATATVYAVAASAPGARWLRRFGFTVRVAAAERADQRDLYHCAVNHQSAAPLVMRCAAAASRR
ncbi:MAG: hypothetical protein WCG26_05845 [Chloroflexales bacterium]